jgi:phosphoribosylamine--glycine ligase
MREIIHPTVTGMQEEGIEFTGFLYAGLMISPEGEISTLEFNCRMGDPETQPILCRLKSDLVTLLEHATQGSLDQIEAEWDHRIALGVVLAAAGYPENPRKGDAIIGLPLTIEDVHAFHAGTAYNHENALVTNGGRVMCITALGESIPIAQKLAYDAISQIEFSGMQYRHDIGAHALNQCN